MQSKFNITVSKRNLPKLGQLLVTRIDQPKIKSGCQSCTVHYRWMLGNYLTEAGNSSVFALQFQQITLHTGFLKVPLKQSSYASILTVHPVSLNYVTLPNNITLHC